MLFLFAILGCTETVDEPLVMPVPSFDLYPNVPSTRDDVKVLIAPVQLDSTDYQVIWHTQWTNETQEVNGPLLSAFNTSTNERWTVEVWYTAGEFESTHIDYSFNIVGSNSDVELEITPIRPRSNEDIEANIVVYDADQEVLTVEYNWTINGTPLELQSRFLSADQVNKGDEVILTINSLNGEVLTQSPILEFTIRNTPPVLEGAGLTPTQPIGYDTLTVTEDYYDYDQEELSFEYRWFLNDLRLDGRTSPSLSLSDFVREDVFFVETRGFDGEEYTDWVRSQPVTLANTPPIVAGLTISETSPRSDQLVSCGYESFEDFDNDQNETDIVWVRNGQQVGSGPFLDLDAINASPRERIYCVATADDGIELGNTLFDYLSVRNTPPIVYLAQLTPDPAYVTDDLHCSPQMVVDIDGDLNFEYTYQWYINGNTANLNDFNSDEFPPYLRSTMWRADPNDSTEEIPAFKKGDTVVCAVSADDRSPHGSGEGAFTLSNGIQVINTPPTASGVVLEPLEPSVEDIVSCVINDFYDPDLEDENLSNFVWYKNGQFAKNGSDLNLFLFDATLSDVFTCEVQLFDGENYGASYSVSIQATNQPPEISSVEINPLMPTSQDSIVATALFSDPDGDLVTVEYLWTINGIPSSEVSNTLSGPFNPGDEILLDVTPSDGVVAGVTYSVPAIEIVNTPPDSPTVELIELPYGYQCTTASPPIDVDGDLVQVSVDWICDGQPLSNHSDYTQISSQITTFVHPMDLIPLPLLSTCFLWQCSIDLSDGVDSSGPVLSNLVIP